MTDTRTIPATTIARLQRLGKNNLALACAGVRAQEKYGFTVGFCHRKNNDA
ncbi:MAG: hypothetical protein SPL47_05790 [Bacteroidales bacterium]|nr:hypothetical protein [Bacteroidales bacterium]